MASAMPSVTPVDPGRLARKPSVINLSKPQPHPVLGAKSKPDGCSTQSRSGSTSDAMASLSPSGL
jgi:hypothetical protein